MLEQNGIISSMSRPGCPYDNSCMESFFATLKKECIYRKRYATMEEVRRDIFSYVELFYNRKRMHSFLGYLSPVAYRRKNQGGEAA
jgi:putative transposase